MRAPLLVAALGAAVLLGCPSDPKAPEPPPPSPQVLEFSASAAKVHAGDTVTLTWKTKNATAIDLRDSLKGAVSGVDGARTSGSVDVVVGGDSLFVLTATNARGVRDSKAVTLHAEGGATSVLFTASPTHIAAGESTVLTWAAFGAREVWLRDSTDKSLDLEGQLDTGSLSVSPSVTTSYVLSVDGNEYKVEVQVQPTLGELVATPNWAIPGGKLTLSWKTVGARKVSLVLLGRGEVASETDPANVAQGSFDYAVPADISPSAVLTFQLLAEDAHDQTWPLGTLEVYVGGSPRVTEWRVPAWAKAGDKFIVRWKTTGADVIEILEDGSPIFRTPVDASLAAGGAYQVVTPTVERTYQLRALKQRGGEARSLEFKVVPISPPTIAADGFTASPQPGIQNAGEPVTLTWNVPNARNLKIIATNQYDVTTATGVAAETGTVTVFPNVDTEYVLTADDTVGDSVLAKANVKVASPAKLVFSPPNAPNNAIVTVTSHGVLNGAQVSGLPTAVKNAPGEAFVDISVTGVDTAIARASDTTAQSVVLSEVFTTRLFGQTVSGNVLSVSVNGWFKFSTSAVFGQDTPTPFPTVNLEPNAIAPLWADLAFATPNGTADSVKTQIDSVGADRRLIVQWTKLKVDPIAASEVTFQAQLYSSGKVVFAYKNFTNTAGLVAAIGVVNSNESSAVIVPEIPANGDTWTLFGPTTLPAQMTVVSAPYRVRVATTQDHFVEIETNNPVVLPGQFKISEVNPRPAPGVVGGQWFELENTTSNPIPLQDWSVDFGGGSTHKITSALTLPANGRLVLGQSPTAGDGVAVDYAYGNTFSLASSTSVAMMVPGNTFAPLATPAIEQGRSWQSGPFVTGILVPLGATTTECTGTASYGTHNQRGTPGAANTPCPNYLAPSSIPGNFETIAATGTRICTANADYSVDTVTPAVPFNLMRVSVPTVYVNTNGFISQTAYTCPSPTNCYDFNRSTAQLGAVPQGTIAPFWDDLNSTAVGAGVFWQSRDPDAVPNNGDEYTIISWEKVIRKGQAADNLNFQVKLFANGNIEYHFGTMSDHGSGATTWLEEPGGRAAWPFNANSTTSPGIASNSAIRFTLQ